MSIDADQTSLDADEWNAPEHLTKQTAGLNVQEPVRKNREFACTECEHRVTRSVDLTCEWGHEEDCDHHATNGGAR